MLAQNRWTPWDVDQEVGAGRGANVRVYCLPHAGGSAGAYLTWSRSHAAPGLSFVPVELPGRGTRLGEPPLASMDDVVEGFLSVLHGRPAGERFLLMGHSMGAQIAYEAARRLAARGSTAPEALVVSGCRPPGAPVALPVHGRRDSDLLKGIIALGGTSPEVLQHRDLLAMLLPVLRADLGLLARYMTDVRPTALACPILALAGADDRLAGPPWVTGWRMMTAGAFRHQVLPGGHFFLYDRPADVMAEILQTARETGGRN